MKVVAPLFLALVAVIEVCAQVPAVVAPANFANWGYSPAGVFGINKLDKPTQRSYYRIWKTDISNVKIQSIDAAGNVITTIGVQFVGGRINSMAWTDRWNDTYQRTQFTPAGVGQYYVTTKSSGVNSYLPAKRAKYTYVNNLLAEVRYFSYDDRPIALGSGVGIVRYKRYAEPGRYSTLKEITYFDENDVPIISKSDDAHRITYERDPRGNAIVTAYFGVNDEPLTTRFGGFKTKNEFDGDDRIIRGDIYGLNDTRVRNAYGVASTLYEYTNGFLTKVTRLDENGNITKASNSGDGIAQIRYEYDDQGNRVVEAYFDEKGAPMNDHAGAQRQVSTFIANGVRTSFAYFDKEGKAAADSAGIHRYNYVSDEKGRTIQKSYFDMNDKPVKDNFDEVFMVKYKYDEQGRSVSDSYWQDANTKMNRWDGYHEDASRYDDDGRVIEDIRYDADGKLIAGKSGFSRATIMYGKNGKVFERKFFNGDVPATVVESFASGFHSIKTTWDDKGHESTLEYFDVAGRPVNAKFYFGDNQELSYHKIEFIYQGNTIVEERLYEVNSTVPGKIIDTLKNDYIGSGGLSLAHKNRQ